MTPDNNAQLMLQVIDLIVKLSSKYPEDLSYIKEKLEDRILLKDFQETINKDPHFLDSSTTIKNIVTDALLNGKKLI